MRRLVASFFRLVFRVDCCKKYYFGLYKKVFKPLNLFKGITKQVTYKGQFVLNLELEDWIPQNIYFLHSYEEKEINFISKFLKPGDCFVDVGANIGLFSLVAAKTVGIQGKVIAFEPFQRNYKELTKHIQLNSIPNITAENTAISDKEGNLELHWDRNEQNYGMVSRKANDYTTKELVKATSLDRYFIDKNFINLRLIKMDIEGGEHEAVVGMQGVLKKYKPALLIEINPDQESKNPDKNTELLLQSLQYKKYFLNAGGEISETKSVTDDSNNFVFLQY